MRPPSSGLAVLDPPPTAAPLYGTWDSVPGSVAAARRMVADYAGGCGATQRTRDAIALAVSEAVAKAVMHAYPDGPEAAGTVSITAWPFAAGRITVVVGDDGCGLPADEERSGLGLGLAVIAQLAERVELASGDGVGTRITMVFVLET